MGLKALPANWHDAPTLRLYTDGSSVPNPNTDRGGGWGWVLCEPGAEASPVEGASGRCPGPTTTNQRSELRAAIYGLTHVLGLCESGAWTGGVLEVHTDSEYVIGHGCGRWRVTRKLANADLANQLHAAVALLVAAGVRVGFRYIEAHAGHPGNEAADKLAGLWRGAVGG
jgi:ribonuclease HI